MPMINRMRHAPVPANTPTKEHVILIKGFPSQMAAQRARPALQICTRRLHFAGRRLFAASSSEKDASFCSGEDVSVLGHAYPRDEMTNVTPHVLARASRKLLHQEYNPLNIIKGRIMDYFNKSYVSSRGTPRFVLLDNLSPVVTLEQNFDSLLIGEDHPMRSRSDNYFINSNYMLRAHTSAHQRDLVQSGLDRFLVAGDVYRRDAIDATHYPAFHQMEGVALFTAQELFGADHNASLRLLEATTDGQGDGQGDSPQRQKEHTVDAVTATEADLKETLTGLVQHLFGQGIETRWIECYFPFTHPSFELEIKFQGTWLEVLGCGVMRQAILAAGGCGDKIGWAFGLGLDRLAMLLFSIPDIRLLWSKDPRFIDQFRQVGGDSGNNIVFSPFSKYPPCYKDLSFWLPREGEGQFVENDMLEVVRAQGGDLVECVEMVDSFVHPKLGRESRCYRITYRSMERNVTNKEVNQIQSSVRSQVAATLPLELR